MAYDQELADRIRRLIGSHPEMTEKKMFGGVAFLIGGNMAIAASSHGGAMIRVDPEQSGALVATTPASVVQMRGRPMRGWLHVSSADLSTDGQLTTWIEKHRVRALATAQELMGLRPQPDEACRRKAEVIEGARPATKRCHDEPRSWTALSG